MAKVFRAPVAGHRLVTRGATLGEDAEERQYSRGGVWTPTDTHVSRAHHKRQSWEPESSIGPDFLRWEPGGLTKAPTRVASRVEIMATALYAVCRVLTSNLRQSKRADSRNGGKEKRSKRMKTMMRERQETETLKSDFLPRL